MSDSHGTWPGLRIPPVLHWLAWSCTVAAALIVLPAQAAAWTFVGELMVHWTAHAACLLVVPLIIWRRERRHCVALLIMLALALWPWLLAAWSPRSPPTREAQLTVATFNLYIRNPAVAADIPALRACAADVMVLIETDAADQASLRGDLRWPYQHWVAHGTGAWKGLGLAVLSQHPVAAFVTRDLAGDAAIEVRLICAGRPLRIVAVHPHAPISTAAWQVRDQQFAQLSALIAETTGPVVVLGDLNCTVADPAWRRLLADTGLRRAAGRAPATWPAELGPFGIAIDHILAGNGAQVVLLSSVVVEGSDHRGLFAAIALGACRK